MTIRTQKEKDYIFKLKKLYWKVDCKKAKETIRLRLLNDYHFDIAKEAVKIDKLKLQYAMFGK